MPLVPVSVTCYDETLNLHTCHQSLFNCQASLKGVLHVRFAARLLSKSQVKGEVGMHECAQGV